jgi:hypothetical protein
MPIQKPQISNVSDIDICPHAHETKPSSPHPNIQLIEFSRSIIKEVYELKIHMHAASQRSARKLSYVGNKFAADMYVCVQFVRLVEKRGSEVRSCFPGLLTNTVDVNR